jgi:hypothetical protein
MQRVASSIGVSSLLIGGKPFVLNYFQVVSVMFDGRTREVNEIVYQRQAAPFDYR